MKCDVVVLEVGMGGRFDASNVINSHLSVVTSIGEYEKPKDSRGKRSSSMVIIFSLHIYVQVSSQA